MTDYAALLRAVNVGGGNVLRMETLSASCGAAGFTAVRTVGASGNVLFRSDEPEHAVRNALERELITRLGAPVGVIVRTVAELAAVAARQPFPDAPPDRIMALFTDHALPADPLADVSGRTDEQLVLGERELFVFYPRGMGRTRLRIPAAAYGTARNMNTVTRLAGPVILPSRTGCA